MKTEEAAVGAVAGGGLKRTRLNSALRIAERRETDATKKKALSDIRLRKNKEAFETLLEGLERDYEESAAAGGPLMDFLDWLMANLPAILEMIMKLLPLFV